MSRSLSLILAAAALLALVVWGGLLRDPADTSSLTADELKSLKSVEKLNDHPLYVMRYYGPTTEAELSTVGQASDGASAWACALFAALGDAAEPVYGRNFDWPHHPAMVLIASPPDGYASIAMVDLSFILPPEYSQTLHQLAVEDQAFLLQVPHWTFDGMNDQGLAIGMAAVADTIMPYDASLETVGSLQVMRRVLDRASSVDEAIRIFESVNVDMRGGPTVHYLLADSGSVALIEYWEGEMLVTRPDDPWFCATNYYLCQIEPAERSGVCWRYDLIQQQLLQNHGSLGQNGAMELLESVSWESPRDPSFGTQWSVVYNLETLTAHVAMGHQYDAVYSFEMLD